MNFLDMSEITAKEIFPGVKIRAPHGENLMLSIVDFDPDAQVPLHSHPHEQGGVLLEGRMELQIGSESRVLEPGEFYLIPPNIPHRATAVGGSARALDIFSPIREDYAAMWVNGKTE